MHKKSTSYVIVKSMKSTIAEGAVIWTGLSTYRFAAHFFSLSAKKRTISFCVQDLLAQLGEFLINEKNSTSWSLLLILPTQIFMEIKNKVIIMPLSKQCLPPAVDQVGFTRSWITCRQSLHLLWNGGFFRAYPRTLCRSELRSFSPGRQRLCKTRNL